MTCKEIDNQDGVRSGQQILSECGEGEGCAESGEKRDCRTGQGILLDVHFDGRHGVQSLLTRLRQSRRVVLIHEDVRVAGRDVHLGASVARSEREIVQVLGDHLPAHGAFDFVALDSFGCLRARCAEMVFFVPF